MVGEQFSSRVAATASQQALAVGGEDAEEPDGTEQAKLRPGRPTLDPRHKPNATTAAAWVQHNAVSIVPNR